MLKSPFPKAVMTLPQADIAFKGVKGWLSQAKDHQLVFMDIAPIGEVAPHAHGAQWGVVVDGAMELTIGGKTQTYRKGDSYFIPKGTVHSARFQTRTFVIDFFADKKRYKAKKVKAQGS
ncbi:MAG: cupin domain-containing protein [Deltaproteobacteria bacterium]|nr:cupin domain-containing protein [Deltaproteobacteria bacterium]